MPDADDPRLWAWRKARDVATHLNGAEDDTIILGADTVVLSRERPLGKPRDEEEAREMLLLLRATDHFVVTGYAILHSGEVESPIHINACLTRVWMRDFNAEELTGYVTSGEPFDKAGAYALQGLGGRLVERVEGCATNVIGLPLCEVRGELEELGVATLPLLSRGYCDFCPSMGLTQVTRSGDEALEDFVT